MRSLPKALRPLTSRSFNRVPFPYFEPSFHVSEVSYLFLWLIIVYITIAVYLLLSKISQSFVERGLLDFTPCTIPLGLNVEFFLTKLRFQTGFIAKRDKKHLTSKVFSSLIYYKLILRVLLRHQWASRTVSCRI
jgi:hypothetical protein